MRWVRDVSGRFPRRPHYDNAELEATCADLLDELSGVRALRYPVSTDDLTVLIERRAADLDLYCEDLPDDVEAATDFVPGERPRVRVAARLSGRARSAHRLRTTLAHELAHVVLHNFLWWFDAGARPPAERAASLSPKCGPRGVATDWMEWQANYCAGALLMPASAVREAFGAPEGEWQRSARGRALARSTQAHFEVSAPAAIVRLGQLGYLGERPRQVVRSPVPRRW